MVDGFAFGCAKVDVTPPAGLPMAGYASRKGPALGAHDSLFAKASVCRCGDQEVALCAVDIVGLSRAASNEIRAEIEARTGIAPAHALIATTHTHSGPVTTEFRNAIPDPDYMATLRDGIAAAVEEARASVRPARIGTAQAQTPDFHYNRRNEDQPVDDTLGVVRFVSADDATLATWINYGGHPTILGGDNLLYSADFPGVACGVVEAELDGLALFLNGCLGDVGTPRPVRTFEQAGKVGMGLAEAVLRAARAATYDTPERVEAGQIMCRAPLAEVPSRPQLHELADRATGPAYQAMWARDQIQRRVAGEAPAESVELEVQWFRVGGLSIACFPGQMFGGWGVSMRERWAGGPLLIVNQANAHDGYFPTEVGFERGGYEARSAFMFNSDLPASVTWEAGQRMVDAALHALA